MKTISAFTLALTISTVFSVTAATQPSLGTSALLEAPGAGVDSVVLAVPAPTNTWTATANEPWLHLDMSNQSGAGSTNVVFSYDANPAATRTGTLTIAGQTLTVTQAGSTYVAAPGPVTALVSSGLSNVWGVAVDSAGNAYIADTGNNAIKKWTATNNTVTTLVAVGLNSPAGVAVDSTGNVYFSDSGNNAIKKWTAADHTVTTLVSSGLSAPMGVAVDGAGNVYIADNANNALKEWMAADNTVTTLVVTSGPYGVAVDSAGNVYFTAGRAIKKWSAANGSVTTLVGGGPLFPTFFGVAVDGAGNAYMAYTSGIKKWSAASSIITTLAASYSLAVAVDSAGDVYFPDNGNSAIKELPRAFVDPVPKSEGPAPATDVLPVVLPATANLVAPFAPASDQPWLTITGITNGVVTFAFASNTDLTNRTAHITLLGQSITVTQLAGITLEPAQMSVCAGSPAIFSAGPTGGDLTYQWQVSGDSGVTFTNISETATNASYTNAATTLADNGSQYQVIIAWGGQVFTPTPPAVLTVGAPATASAGGNQTICAGNSTLGLGGTVGGAATGGAWSSSGTGSFSPNATTLDATYMLSAGDITAGTVTLTLSATGQPAPCAATAQVIVTVKNPPVIAYPPANLAVYPGYPATFSVAATGTALGFQWQVSRDGAVTFTNISPTATNSSYTTAPTALADNSNRYRVLVSGGCWPPATSAPPAVLTVDLGASTNGLPIITQNPQGSTVHPGWAVTFSVFSPNAAGYQWRFNGVDIPGATNWMYQIANPQASNTGYYIAIAKNANGWMPSQKAYLGVVSDQGVAPFSNVGFGQVYMFNALSSGVAALVAGPELDQMQPVPMDPWWPDLTTAAIVNGYYDYGDLVTVPTVSPGQTVYYRVEVSPGRYSRPDPSRVLTLVAGGGSYPTPSASAIQFPSYIEWPDPVPMTTPVTNQAHSTGETVTLTASYWCCGDFGYPHFQWRKDGVLIPGATNYTGGISLGAGGCFPFLTITNAQAADAGNYDLVINGSYSFIDVNTSFSIQFTNVAVPVVIAGEPADVAVCAGSPAVFSVTAIGASPTYQWQVSRDGGSVFTNISATATNASHTNSIPTVADNGSQYQVIVGVGGVLVTSAPPAVLTVTAPPTASAGVSQVVCSNNCIQLAGAVGSGATGGQWTSSGTGTFTPNATTLNAQYCPSVGDVQAGSVTLTLTTTGQPAVCPAATAQVVEAFLGPPTAAVGGNQTVCVGSCTLGLGGQVGGCATGGVWTTSGTGIFAPNAATLNALYCPSASDAGQVITLTLTSTGPCLPCAAATAQLMVTVRTFALGTGAVVEGPSADSDSVVLAAGNPTDTWAAAANAPWLHLRVANQSGTGSTNVVFSYDANPGATRTGTLTIAGQTLTVTQVGSAYITAPGPVTVLASAGLSNPDGVAVDGTGNVYICDYNHNAIKKWTASSNTVTTLVSSGLNIPHGVAVDSAGNVFIADTFNDAIKKWTAANNVVTTLVGSGLNKPVGVAVDVAGNVYISDFANNALKKWTAASNTVSTLVALGLNQPWGVAVDAAGNVYVADRGNAAIKKWTAVSGTVTTLVATGLNQPWGVAVDGAGNVYFTDSGNNALKKWTAGGGAVSTLVGTGLNHPYGAAADGAGNLYFSDSYNGAVKELPRAFVNPTVRPEDPASGTDVLPVVLPVTANLLAPFAPTSDHPWLSITGITNGVVGFAFSATTSNRTANITLLGQPIAISQSAVTRPTLIGPTLMGDGTFQFAFSNNDPGATFTVLTTTNPSLPLSNWTVAGPATNTIPGLFQFSTDTTNNPQGFYRVRSP
jgi:DNA-binding beta-propeller fold protein YncE